MGVKQFFQQRVWSEMPEGVSTRQRLLAAFVWGGALILWGSVLAWHRHHLGQAIRLAPLAAIVAGSVLLGLMLIPSVGDAIYQAALHLFAVIGFFINTVLLVIAFYCVVTPMGWVLKLCGKDLLDVRDDGPPSWKEHTGRTERKRYYRLS